MSRTPYSSLDELLAPKTLTQLIGCSITSAQRGPFVGGHSASGSEFLAIKTNDGQGPRLVVKRSSPECDWIVRGTDDRFGREVLVWTSGLLDRLPPEITHPVIACARAREGWAILMHDVSHQLMPDPMGHSPIPEADHRRYLDALAALHAAFWEQRETADPALGLCSPWHRFSVFSPQTGQREADHPNAVVREIREGWDLLWTLLEPDVTAVVRPMLADPVPLCAALARYPHTLIHGDPRGSNIGIAREPQSHVVLIDWHLTGPGAAAADLAWYLSNLGIKSPVANETSIAWYRDALAARLGPRFNECWWRPHLELSLLGQLVRLGWGHAWEVVHNPIASVRAQVRESLTWWSERAREGARWL
ncbi:MAG: phosphotransferase [Chloroflexia bacterium]|nr:phosphotransferase [Chloroflexia bacterium]